MKTKILRNSRRSLSIFLVIVLIFTSLFAGSIFTANANGREWKGNVFFRAPDGWDLSTNPKVQVWAVQSTSASTGGKEYSFLLGNMSIVGTTSNSKLYHYYINGINHSGWGDSEYLAFTANSSNWTTGNFYISTCGQYTEPLDYGVNNGSGAYLFSPSDADNNIAANNNTMSGNYNGTNRDVIKSNQDYYVYTDGSASAAGGTVTATCHYVSGNNYSGNNAIASNSITVNSSDTGAHEQYTAAEGTKATLVASANSNYNFDGWYDGADSSSATCLSTNTTYTYYVHREKSVYAHFTYNEPKYNITIQSGGNGTVSKTSVEAGSISGAALGTATPAYGYKFKNWTYSGGGIKITSSTSATDAVATASSTGGVITANFEPDTSMNLYIAGRFHVQTTDTSGSWTNSFDSGNWSNTGDENIKFTYVSGTTYKVETHASIKNLSDQIINYDPWFFIYDQTNSKYWYRTTADTYLTSSNKSTTLTKYDSQTDSQNAKLRFNDQSTDKPVTLYFNVATGALSYTVPNFYNIGFTNKPTGGTVTVTADGTENSTSPVRLKENTSYTVKIKPDTGYDVDTAKIGNTSIKNSLSGNATNGYTYTTTATADSTYNVTFKKIDYTITYPTPSGYTIGGSKPSTANYGDNVSFTVTPSTNFRIDSVTCTKAGGGSVTVSQNGTTYSFTMPADNVTITITSIAQKILTITKSVGSEGINKIQYKIGSGSNTTYSAPVPIDTGSKVTITVTYTNGWEYKAHSFDGASGTKSSNTSFIINNMNSDTTFDIQAKKAEYTITVNNSTGLGSAAITDANGHAITKTTIGEKFYVTVTSAENYAFNSFSATGTGLGTGTLTKSYVDADGTSTATREYTMGYGNVTVTPSFVRIRRISLASDTSDNVTTSIHYTKIDGSGEATLNEGQTIWARATSTTIPYIYVNPTSGYKMDIVVKDGSTSLTTLNDVTHKDSGVTNWPYSAFGNYTTTAAINIVATEDLSTDCIITGDFNSWDTTSTSIKFKKRSGASDSNISYAELDINVPNAKAYSTSACEFKIIQDGTWYTNPDISFTTDGTNVMNVSGGSDNNAKFSTTVAGRYTFMLDTSNNSRSISLTYPDQNISYSGDSNLTYHTEYHPTTSKYTRTVTIKVKANSNYKIDSINVANQTSNYDSYTPTNKVFTPPTVNYNDSASAEYYYEYTFTMGKDHVNVTFTTSQISLGVTPNITSAGFSTKIYNDAGTQEITTIQTGQFYKIVAVAKDETYTITDTDTCFSDDHKPAHVLTSSGNTYTFRCRAGAYNLDAGINYIAATPIISVNGVATPAETSQTINMTAGKSNDLSSVISVAKKATNGNSWIKLAIYDTQAHAKNGPDTTTGRKSISQDISSVTAPSTKGTYYMCIYAFNKPTGTDGAYSQKIIVTVNVTYARTTANFYVDVHSFNIQSGSNNMVEIFQSQGENAPYYQDDNDDDLIKDLEPVSNSTIYQAIGMNIPDNNINVYAKVTINSVETWVTLSASQISNAPNHVLDIWLEATAPERYAGTSTTPTTVSNMPESGKKRIYLCKSSDVSSDWSSIYLYAWQTDPFSEPYQWDQAPRMKDLGYKTVSGKTDYYFYLDINSNCDMVVFKGSNGKQTGNISLAGGSNFYKLNKDLSVTSQTKVTQPKLTSFYSSININAGAAINIKPLGVPDGAKITYTPADSNVVSVNDNGLLTAKSNGLATARTSVTIRVEGSIHESEGLTLYDDDGGNVGRDYYEKTVSVNVRDDTLISGVKLMSYGSASTTVNIVNLSGAGIPARIVGVDTRLTIKGTQYKTLSVKNDNVTTYTYCGLVTFDNENNTVTIKYAKPDSTTVYNGYTSANTVCEAKVITEIQETGQDGERYGFEKWQKNSIDLTPSSTYTDDCYITIDGNPYSKCFKSYQYTDIYVNFNYYDYNVEREDGTNRYFYDPEYVDEDNSRNKFADTHVLHTYTKVYEVRDISRDAILSKSQADKNSLMNTAALAKLVNVKSNYYTYSYNANCIDTESFDAKANTNHGVEFNVTLSSSVRTYKVYLDGTQVFTTTPIYYQTQVDFNSSVSGIDGETVYEWKSRKTKNDSENLVTVATAKTYKFRVTDDTYLTVEGLGGGTNLTEQGKASVVTHSGYEVQRDDALSTDYDILYQNFYIADFYNTNKMAEYTISTDEIDEYGDPTGNIIDETKKHDLSFVGGGVLYYSVDNSTGAVNNKVLDNRYVTSDAAKAVYYDETSDTYPILEKIRELIEAQNSDKNIAYGTPSGYVQGSEEKGKTVSSGTGFFYRYLPYMQYNSVSKECDIKNSDTYRYSTALGAFQYIFSQGMTNKLSTKNMRVYSYYVYSYNDYENKDGELVYKYVISSSSVDAATYINNATINS